MKCSRPLTWWYWCVCVCVCVWVREREKRMRVRKKEREVYSSACSFCSGERSSHQQVGCVHSKQYVPTVHVVCVYTKHPTRCCYDFSLLSVLSHNRVSTSLWISEYNFPFYHGDASNSTATFSVHCYPLIFPRVEWLVCTPLCCSLVVKKLLKVCYQNCLYMCECNLPRGVVETPQCVLVLGGIYTSHCSSLSIFALFISAF